VKIAEGLPRPAKDHAVKAAQHTLNLIAVFLEKALHDSLHHDQGIVMSSWEEAASKARFFASSGESTPRLSFGCGQRPPFANRVGLARMVVDYPATTDSNCPVSSSPRLVTCRMFV
jgi:hypothetical protein